MSIIYDLITNSYQSLFDPGNNANVTEVLKNLKKELEEESVSTGLDKADLDNLLDLFCSLTKGGLTTHDILKNILEKIQSKSNNNNTIKSISEKYDIKVVQSDYKINKLDNKKHSFFLKKNDKVYGHYTNQNNSNNNGDEVVKINDLFHNSKDYNSSPDNPNLTKPNFSVLLYNQLQTKFSNAQNKELKFFFNDINNMDIAKLYPYANVIFEMPSLETYGITTKDSTSSINRFLFGSVEGVNTTNVYRSFDNLKINAESDEENLTNILTMNMFTSPNTQNNFDEKYLGYLESQKGIKNRRNSILDVTKPFGTITSINISEKPISSDPLRPFRTATMKLTIHDRTRMPDVIHFFSPAYYSNQTCRVNIEYGWNHLESEQKDNLKAQILDQLKVRDSFIVKTATTSSNESGGVDITLELYTHNLLEQRILLDSEFVGLTNNINGSFKKINAVINKINDTNKKNKIPIRYNFASENKLGDVSSYFKTRSIFEIKKLDEMISILQNSKNIFVNGNINATEFLKLFDFSNSSVEKTKDNEVIKSVIENLNIPFIRDIIQIAFDNDESPFNKIKENITKIKEVISNKNSDVLKKLTTDSEDDPFFDKEIKKLLREKFKDDINSSDYITFGKLMTGLIGNYVTSSKDLFEEIQLVFNTVNDNSGLMKNKNIASFLIEKKDLIDFLNTQVMSSKKNYTFTVQSFITLIIKRYIHVESNQIAYGLGTKKGDNIEEVRSDRLNQLGGSFKKPNIDFKIQFINPTNKNKLFPKSVRNRRVYKIIFYDKTDSSLDSLLNDFLNVNLQTQNLVKINQTIRSLRNLENEKNLDISIIKLINIIGKENIKQINEGKLVLNIPELEGIKKKIKNILPQITIGSQNSPITKASFSTKNHQVIGTIKMIDSDKSYEISGVKFDNELPMPSMHGDVSISTLGCPIASIGNLLFIDFLTNTSIDNSYFITEVNHSISQGKFETDIKLSFNDAYGTHTNAINNIYNVLKNYKDRTRNFLPASVIEKIQADITKKQKQVDDIEKIKIFIQKKGYTVKSDEVNKKKKVDQTKIDTNKIKEFNLKIEKINTLNVETKEDKLKSEYEK